MWTRLRLDKLPGVLSHLWALGLLCLTSVALLLVSLLNPIPLQNLRLAQFDQFQRWHPRTYTPQAVRVVDIDEASLQEYGQWPWPRTRLTKLVERLHQMGASAIALDILLTEPDRTSPKAMAQLWKIPQGSTLLSGLRDHDAVLASALPDRQVVLGASLSRTGQAAKPATSVAPSATPYRIVSTGAPEPARWLHGFDAAIWPLPVLMATTQGVGALNFSPDNDSVVRRVPLVLRLGEQIVPTLSAEALRVAQGGKNHVLRSHAGGIQEVRIGNLSIPTTDQAEIWLHYTRDEPTRFLSAKQVLQDNPDANHLKGHIVLVGSSADGLKDLRANPMGRLMPGVLAHALALEQILAGHHLQRPAWAGALEALLVLFGSLAIGLVALGAPVKKSAAVLVLALGATLGVAWLAFVAGLYLIDGSTPALAMLLSFGLASGIHHGITERQQRWLKAAFSRYVSPNRVAHLVAHPEQLHLGGKRQVCSFVFTDLSGFTGMVEGSDPAELVARLNDYLDAMLAIVFKHEGTLDRIVGDAVAVLFSAPVPQSDHRQRALDCALEMDAFASAYAARLQAQGVPWGQTRIGVHSGEVIVGNFGGKTLFDYRALGDPINTAARLESVNKHLGTRMCVSQAVCNGCIGVPLRAVARLVLKGKTQPLQVFTPQAALNAADCAPAQAYEAAMQLLRTGCPPDAAKALVQLEALWSSHPRDPLVALHVQRLRMGALDDLMVMANK